MKKSIKTKRKPARKKTIRRRKSRPRLGIYLLAALATIFMMWILIREPQSAPEDFEQTAEVANAKREAKPVKAKPEKASDDPSKSPEEGQVQSPDEKVVKQEVPKEGETQVDMAIRKAAAGIGVPDSALKRKKSSDLISYNIPIDRSRMDLTYANMIFKGNLEQVGARLLKGEDSHNRQILSFSHKAVPEKYRLELFYESKYYKDSLAGKKISIVVDDFGGIGGKLLDGFFDVDKQVCFAIFPGETNSKYTMQRAGRQGREVLIHVPMEPIGYPSNNPGKNAILVQHSEAHIEKLMDSFIAELPDAIGINNHMGSLATTDPEIMQYVMNSLKKHDKAFLDSRTTNVSVAFQTAQKSHLKAYRNDLFLDSPNISQSTMDDKLNQIIQLASTKKHIIAITHCHNEDKLDYLKRFIARLKKAGFTLVPLSEYGSQEVPEIL
ncbi:MAG: divergent polysaccharide deacetylase family protein [Candidatus Cloacimonetes bacterium]|nr:divergent polysaccharide deacetylase family protein [Candidatus Cloacimonadota bacterium]MDD4805248.1 divergent polysaccharide deacetylase family protein [Candidatus Cloacimonadota bacterium]